MEKGLSYPDGLFLSLSSLTPYRYSKWITAENHNSSYLCILWLDIFTLPAYFTSSWLISYSDRLFTAQAVKIILVLEIDDCISLLSARWFLWETKNWYLFCFSFVSSPCYAFLSTDANASRPCKVCILQFPCLLRPLMPPIPEEL